jgi:IS5 family transposase
VILPKRGRLNKEDRQRESDKKFRKLRYAHSAVESNINMLEHHGLNRCMDKGLHGYKRCVGVSVLAYNLHHLGNVLLAKERKFEERRQKELAKAA